MKAKRKKRARKAAPKKPATKKVPKITQEEMARRVEQVLRIRLLGAQFHDIRQYASETDEETGRPWNVCDRQLRRYIDATDDLLVANAEKDRDKIIARHLAQRQALYARAMEAGDLKAALAVMKDECDLRGLYPPKAIVVDGSVKLAIVEEIVSGDEGTAPGDPQDRPAAPDPAVVPPK